MHMIIIYDFKIKVPTKILTKTTLTWTDITLNLSVFQCCAILSKKSGVYIQCSIRVSSYCMFSLPVMSVWNVHYYVMPIFAIAQGNRIQPRRTVL